MVSPLSGLSLQGAPDQTLNSVLGGRQSYERSQLNQQALQQGEQQISRSDYDQATQRLGVINRLAEKARSLATPQEREVFINSINPEMLKSVGIDPASIANAPRDDQGLDALIAQTGAALPKTSQYRKESVSTTEGLKVYDPATGTYADAVGSSGQRLIAPQYDAGLQAEIARQKALSTGGVELALSPEQKRREAQAQADVELSTQPTITAATTEARTTAEQNATKRQAEAVGAKKLGEVQTLYESLSSADLGKIYGRGESVYPELLRSQSGIDLLAKRDQLVSMLKLGARGELKGQGTITDSETKMLADAATILGNPNISPEEAKSALDRAMTVFKGNAGKQTQDAKTVNWSDL